MVKDIINEHKAQWYEVDGMNGHDAEIQKIITQLDGVAVMYEVKWGVGILQEYCSPELLDKWIKQCEKFRKALMQSNVDDIRDIAAGFIRAYKVLEDNVLSQGYNPREASFMAFEYGGKEVIVCGDNNDVRIMVAKRKGKHNVVIVSMSEVAQMLVKPEPDIALYDSDAPVEVSPKIARDFDWDAGDEIPW